MIRRKFMGTLALGSISLAFGSAKTRNSQKSVSPLRTEGSLRFLQFTDTHVLEDKDSPKHMELFLEKAREVIPEPDVIFHTGDVIMDALEIQDRNKVSHQWKLWHSLKKALPGKVHYAIGNHDIWGGGPRSDAMYGKKWALEEMELQHRFYSFNRGPWKFVVLDSTQTKGDTWYTAFIDDVQKEWLIDELDNTDPQTNVMIVSHIPILSTSIFDWAKSENGLWSVSGGLMHSDSHDVRAILRNYPQVRLCISGHLHLLDKMSYDGIDYLGSGAVSGSWWRSETFHGTQCGFSVFDLYPDGSYKRTYYEYEWQ
ncbi:MAG: metallophosphoesterase [Bacteroidota bacterium]